MQAYVEKNMEIASEYLESGIHNNNSHMVIQGKNIYSQMLPIASGDTDFQELIIDKIIRACTAMCIICPQEALKYLEEAKTYKQDHPVVYNNLGFIYHTQTGNYDLAISNYDKCLSLDPTYTVAYLGIIDIFSSLRRTNIELEYAKRGIKHCPDSPDLWNSYGLALLNNQMYTNMEEITKVFLKALDLCTKQEQNKTKAKIYVNIGHVYGILGNYYASVDNYIESIKCDPTHQHGYQNILLNIHYYSNSEINNKSFVNLLTFFNVKSDKSVAKLINQLHISICKQLYGPDKDLPFPKLDRMDAQGKDRKIRIGYVSADLFEHAVSYFSNALFKYYTKDFYEVYVYANNIYNVKDVNSLNCDKYTCIKPLSAEQGAELIRNDNIDILIDLSGQTAGNRLDIFTYKPAPVLLSYLGYPNDVGIPFIRRISDKYTELTGYSKNVIKLDRLFLTYNPLNEVLIEKKWRVKKNIVFGCFAKLQKINYSCIVLWKSILQHVPNSKLVLKSRYFSDPTIEKEWRKKFAPYQERIILLKGTKTPLEHSKKFELLDIHLDTFPYSGTTISTESLCMGIPVVTYSPENGSHVERVTGSILSSMGLSMYVSCTKAGYVIKAVNLARQIQGGFDPKIREKFLATDISKPREFVREFEKVLMNLFLDSTEEFAVPF
jgi:predicted O-linked N-acetylglucosamine transferase (SPINDLY family)